MAEVENIFNSWPWIPIRLGHDTYVPLMPIHLNYILKVLSNLSQAFWEIWLLC